MLQAMNTGHDGSLTTLHANSTREVTSRLVTMVRYASEVPVEVVESYIASAIDVVVQTVRSLDGRRFVSEIAGFYFHEETRRCCTRPFYKREMADRPGRWIEVPEWIDDLPGCGLASAQEGEEWKRRISF